MIAGDYLDLLLALKLFGKCSEHQIDALYERLGRITLINQFLKLFQMEVADGCIT